jgi:hypothetical protein
MASSSGETEQTRIRTINEQMTAKLIESPAQPLTEGSYALRVLESRGRVTRNARQTPIGVLLRGDRRYLVSPDSSRDWVRNLDHHPECALLAGGERTLWQATKVVGEEAAGAVSGYLSAVTTPWALQAFPIAPDAEPDEIRAHLDRIAVFRLSSVDG